MWTWNGRGMKSGLLDFMLNFRISCWISVGFLDFVLDFWDFFYQSWISEFRPGFRISDWISGWLYEISGSVGPLG